MKNNSKVITLINREIKSLDPWWVTGYTDAEGSFMINVFKSKNVNLGYSVKLIYQITAHYSEIDTMFSIKSFFNGVGNIEFSSNGKYVSYKVYKIADIINTIIPHFITYPLQSTKLVYFKLWCKSSEVIDKDLHLSKEGFRTILSYKASLTKKLDALVFKSDLYSDIVPFEVNIDWLTINSTRLYPDYIAGFTAADGSFSLTKPSLTGKWPNYHAYFRIHQNVRDKILLIRMIDVIGCGKVYTLSDGMCNLVVRDKNLLVKFVLPYFDTYPLNANKYLDFLQFKSAVEILNQHKGKGLSSFATRERELLDLCISKMNRRRYGNK